MDSIRNKQSGQLLGASVIFEDEHVYQSSSPDELHSESIDQQPTQVNLKVIDDWVPFDAYRVQDPWAVDGMATWILPIVDVKQIKPAEAKPNAASTIGARGHIALLRNLVKSSGIYALAAVASPLSSLVLAPLLTHNLSLSDYGILTLLNLLISLEAGIFQLGLPSAFFRAYSFDYTSANDRRDVLATVTMLLFLACIPLVIGTAILAPFIAKLLLGRSALGNIVTLASIVVLLQNLTLPGFSWLRAESRAFFYFLLSAGNLFISLIGTIILVYVLHLGIAGSIIATGAGYAFVLICTLPIIILRVGIKMRGDLVRGLLAFGLPLVLNFFSYWVLQLADRYLLSLFTSLAQTAKYSAVYTLGSILSALVIGPFTLAWPTTMFAIAKGEDAIQVFRLVFRWFSLFLLFAAFSLSLVGNVFLDILFPVAYHSSALVIPVVTLSLVFYGVYYIFMVGANIRRKTWLAAVFTTIAAIVNLSLNLILIPYYGLMGAAVATLLGYLALAGVAYIINQRIYPVPFEIGIFTIALILGTFLYLENDFLGQAAGIHLAWGISFLTLLLYGGCLVFLVKLPVRGPKNNC